MYDFYKVKHSDAKLKASRKELKRLYKQIPETEGCKENIAKVGGCGAWCCRNQTPQVMFVEFLNTWNWVLKNHPIEKVSSLLLRAARLYLSDNLTKGCIFWDKKTNLCTQHATRPLNCRMYSQVPDEEFKPRYERLKVLYEKQPGVVLREQCNLTKTIGKKPTTEDSDAWQFHLEQIEEDVVGDKRLITDKDGGSYRAYHDHILLRLGSMAFLAEITKVKVEGTKEQKEAYIKALHKRLKMQHPYLEDTEDEDAPPPPSPIIIPTEEKIIHATRITQIGSGPIPPGAIPQRSAPKPETKTGDRPVGIIIP